MRNGKSQGLQTNTYSRMLVRSDIGVSTSRDINNIISARARLEREVCSQSQSFQIYQKIHHWNQINIPPRTVKENLF